MLIKDARVLDILKDDKFNIAISDYGVYSKKKDLLIQQLKDNGIRFVIYHHGYWKDYGDVVVKGWSKQELREMFWLCKKSNRGAEAYCTANCISARAVHMGAILA